MKKKLIERKRLTSKVLKDDCEKKVYKKKYFTKETEYWIIKFMAARKIEIRNTIFTEHIMPAFQELILSLIKTYKIHKIDKNTKSLEKECLDYMFMKLMRKNFVPGVHKAFSYFNVVCRNFFFQKFKDYNKAKNNQSDDSCLGHASEIKRAEEYRLFRGFGDNTLEDDIVEKDCSDEFMHSLMDCKKIIADRYNDNEILCNKYCSVVDGVCQLFKQCDALPSFKKKAVYLYLREMCKVDSRIITSVFNILREEYPTMSKAFVT